MTQITYRKLRIDEAQLFWNMMNELDIVTGIKKDYRGKGIGKTFFTSLDNWAKGNGIKRLELTVIRTNLVAKRLYEQKGFVVEGTRKNAMKIDGDFVDEFYMAKLL